MPRLLFEKTGNAIWISHLDLMRLFQRAFKRAGLHLKHTQGFNPRPSVSIALPLSVGVESHCELLDFDLEGDNLVPDDIVERLNKALISGVKVLGLNDNGDKIKNLAYLDCFVDLEYDSGLPVDALEKISELFVRPEITVEKKSKNGITEQNISPMIQTFAIDAMDMNTLRIRTRICCQNPTLNPGQFVAAISKYLPEFSPDFSKCTRIEVYNHNNEIFR